MSYIKSRSMQASNYSYITCIVCSIKPHAVLNIEGLLMHSQHKLGENNSVEWGYEKKKIPLTLQPICTDEWAWGLMLSCLQKV